MHQLYLDINALKSPNPDKALKVYLCKRHANSNMVNVCNPPIGNNLATKLHVWQILPFILEANPHGLSTQQIITNGVAWGNETDPVLPEMKKRKVWLKRLKPTIESHEAVEAAEWLRVLMSEETDNSLFSNLSSL